MSDYKDAPNDLAPRNQSSADDWSRAYVAQLEYKLAKAEADNERLREALEGVIRIADRDCPEFRAARAALAEQEKTND
jgi:hypothetical protein